MDDNDLSAFDRFARRTSELVSNAGFFRFLRGPGGHLAAIVPGGGQFDTWQLLINTPTTILTFLLVAALQNSQRRSELGVT